MIRYLTENDLEEFNILYHNFNSKDVTKDDLLNNDIIGYLVYICNNKIIGFLSYSKLIDRSELEYIYVDKEYRNFGYATELLKFYINECLVNGFINITLEVRESNYNAIKLYKKMGFSVISVRKKYYNTEDGFLMIRKLGDVE